MPSADLTPQVIARRALEKLRAQADPERARQVQKYFKETVRSFGVPSPMVRAMTAELYLSLKKEWHIAQAIQLCVILFPRPELEAKNIAALIIARYKKEFPLELFGQIKKWLEQNYLANWASVDTFCPEIMGTLLLSYPEADQGDKNLVRPPQPLGKTGVNCFVSQTDKKRRIPGHHL